MDNARSMLALAATGSVAWVMVTKDKHPEKMMEEAQTQIQYCQADMHRNSLSKLGTYLRRQLSYILTMDQLEFYILRFESP